MKQNTTLPVNVATGAAGHSETIHSGHFMASNVHGLKAEDDEEIDVVSECGVEPPYPEVTPDTRDDDKPVTFYKFGPMTTRSIAIDVSLSKLNKCIQIAYEKGKLTTPKWKNFKGLKLDWKDRIRLNNVIWRAWHMQFVLNNKPKFCFFSIPDEDYWHNRSEATIVEGMYWKRRLETVCAQYTRWRHFHFRHGDRRRKSITKDMSNSSNDLHFRLNSFDDELLFSSTGNLTPPMNFENDDDFTSWFTDTLFSSLNQPYMFPNPKQFAQSDNADLMQPGLIQLQPSIEEIMASLESNSAGYLLDVSSATANNSASQTQNLKQPLMHVPSPPYNLRAGPFRQFESNDYSRLGKAAAAPVFVEPPPTYGQHAAIVDANRDVAPGLGGLSSRTNGSFCASNSNDVFAPYTYQQRPADRVMTSPASCRSSSFDWSGAPQGLNTRASSNSIPRIMSAEEPLMLNNVAASAYPPPSRKYATANESAPLTTELLASSQASSSASINNRPMGSNANKTVSFDCHPAQHVTPRVITLPLRKQRRSRSDSCNAAAHVEVVTTACPPQPAPACPNVSAATLAPPMQALKRAPPKKTRVQPTGAKPAEPRAQQDQVFTPTDVVASSLSRHLSSFVSSLSQSAPIYSCVGCMGTPPSVMDAESLLLHSVLASSMAAPASPLYAATTYSPAIRPSASPSNVLRPIPVNLVARSPTGELPPHRSTPSAFSPLSANAASEYVRAAISSMTQSQTPAAGYPTSPPVTSCYVTPSVVCSSVSVLWPNSPSNGSVQPPLGSAHVPCSSTPPLACAVPKQEPRDGLPGTQTVQLAVVDSGSSSNKPRSSHLVSERQVVAGRRPASAIVTDRNCQKRPAPGKVAKSKKARRAAADSTADAEERKRVLHLYAEQSRRSALKNGFEKLEELMPDLQSGAAKLTNAVVLLKAGEKLRDLKSATSQSVDTLAHLRQQIQQLHQKIESHQKKLAGQSSFSKSENLRPKLHGVVKSRVAVDPKFWLFYKTVEPLLESFAKEVCASNLAELVSSAREWSSGHCTLDRMRPVVMQFLLSLATDSPLLRDPSKMDDFVGEKSRHL